MAAIVTVSAAALSTAAAPPTLSLAASVPAQAGFGTIKGRLVWGGAGTPEEKVLEAQGKASKDPNVCAKAAPIVSHELEVDPKTKGIRFGFAYLVRPKGENPEALKAIVAKNASVVIDQKNCDFLPYATGMTQDQALVFKSSDPTNHNIRYSSFNNGGFNQILPPNGQIQQKLVAERRPIALACDIHPWMHGFIMVFDHPFFAVTGEDGSFEIKGVPPGAQKLVVWQEKVGYVTQGGAGGITVQVQPNQVVDVGDVKLVPKK